MPMQAASLEVLESVEVPAPVARAIVQVFDIEFTAAKETLATKNDLADLRRDLEVKIESVRGDMKGIKGDLMQWTLGIAVTQLAALVGMVYFIVKHLQ